MCRMAGVSLLAGYVVSSGGCWFFQLLAQAKELFALIGLSQLWPGSQRLMGTLVLGTPQYKTLSLSWHYDPEKG